MQRKGLKYLRAVRIGPGMWSYYAGGHSGQAKPCEHIFQLRPAAHDFTSVPVMSASSNRGTPGI